MSPKGVIDALRKNVIHGDGRLYNPAGHNPLMMRAADLLEEFSEECFALAANQCKAGYSGEHGDHMCRMEDRVRELEAAAKDAIGEIEAGAPFTAQDLLRAALSKEWQARAEDTDG